MAMKPRIRTDNVLELRKTIALEKISRCLSTLSECLLTVVDGNDKTLRTKDTQRAKVYSEHLGERIKK